MSGCSELFSLPEELLNKNLGSLEVLDLSECSALEGLYAGVGDLTALQKLLLRDCFCLEYLPDSICHLSNSLEELDLSGCTGLGALPERVGNLSSLKRLVVKGCSALYELPHSISLLMSLQELVLAGSGVEHAQDEFLPCEVVR